VLSGSELTFVCVNCKIGTPSPDVAFDVANDSFNVPREDADMEPGNDDAGSFESSPHVSFNVADVSYNNQPGDDADEDIQVLEDAGIESSLPSDCSFAHLIEKRPSIRP